MTQNTYYLHLKDSFVIAYNSDEGNVKDLPKGEKIIKIETNNPFAYLGLDEKQIYLDPLPEPKEATDKESLDYRRQELKRLFYEIQFTEVIKEDATNLKADYETKLREYNALKTE